MTIIEMLQISRELLNRVRAAGIRLEDTDYIDLYYEYCKIVGEGCKVSYAVASLADRYRISERKVYMLISKFRKHCNLGAV